MRLAGLLALLVSFSAAADAFVPVGPFRSIELSHGGMVTVRYGGAQHVSIVEGDARCTRVRVEGDRLVIDRTDGKCPRGYRMAIDVVTPRLDAVSVSEGGTVQLVGSFPSQRSINAAVEQGGTIDIRAIEADSVKASVFSGGGIFTTVRRDLSAAIASGGAVTYWGDAGDVRKSVRDGGSVKRGKAEDADKPLSSLRPHVAPIAPIAPLPPLRPHG